MTPKVRRYSPMTGISQTPTRPANSRPTGGIPSMAAEERAIMETLRVTVVENTVEKLWPFKSPAQIAAHLRALHPNHLQLITPRWVEGIKRRIDTRNRTP